MEKIRAAGSSNNRKTDAQRTVLVVDDEKFMLEILEKKFTDRGYAVFTAADGEEAIETYCRHKMKIDAVFLDVGLPKVEGVDVLYKMKSENPAVRVVISSGFLEPELRTKMQQAGVEHFIEKPYMLDQVVEVIQGLIEAP
jgi:two-component system cell cycle sensor histidine kinase/response regulator CckA